MKHCFNKDYLFFDNFSSGLSPENINSPYTIAYDGDDGLASVSKYNMNVSSIFTKWNPDGLDHIKYFALTKQYFTAPNDGKELVTETVLSCFQILPDEIPFPYAPPGSATGIADPEEDPRLCAAVFNNIDEETFLVADFFVTNKRVYALYERLPFGRGNGNLPSNYMAFTHLIPLSTRKPEDNIKLSIAYNKKLNYVRWIINDIEMFRVNRLGYPIGQEYRVIQHDGLPELVTPNGFKTGFGAFSLLDAYAPNNLQRWNNAGLVNLEGENKVNPMYTDQNGEPLPLEYIHPSSRDVQVFGQGVDMTLRYISVYIQNPDRTPLRGYKCVKKIGYIPSSVFEEWDGAITVEKIIAAKGIKK